MRFPAGRTFTLLIVTLHFVLFLAGCGQEEEPQEAVIRPVWAIRVANPSDVDERTFPGRARAGKEVNLSYRVSGPLIAFPADVGDEVKKGAVVSRMDPRDFKASLDTVVGQLDQAKAVLESGKFKTKLGPSDRKKLIRQALAIQQVQSKLLDDIDDETRRKLQNLAVDTLFRGRK